MFSVNGCEIDLERCIAHGFKLALRRIEPKLSHRNHQLRVGLQRVNDRGLRQTNGDAFPLGMKLLSTIN